MEVAQSVIRSNLSMGGGFSFLFGMRLLLFLFLYCNTFSFLFFPVFSSSCF